MAPAYKQIVIHFGEIWLKGRNRPAFVKRLHHNIKLALGGERFAELKDERDRFVLYLDEGSDVDSIMGKLGRVFGISWFAPSVTCKNGKADIIDAAKALIGRRPKGSPVRIVASRSYKGLDYNSQDLVHEFIGRQGELGFHIDKNADVELLVNIRKDDAILCAEKIRGAGGLPVGSSGRAVVLLSGGIDSPVASYYAMKRGLAPVYVHVHGFQSNEEAMGSKMKALAGLLAGYYQGAKVYYVPVHAFQASVLKAPKSYELVLFKHFLYRLADRIASLEGAEVIATGESLGQVASQTVKNLIASQSGVRSLIFRPLAGFDKQEIIDKAMLIGSYGISIKPYADVCSMRARHPSTAADPCAIKRLYRECRLGSALSATLKKSAVARIS